MEEGLLTLFAAFFVEKARAYLRRRSEDIELAFEGVGVARLYVEGGGVEGEGPPPSSRILPREHAHAQTRRMVG